MGGVAVDLGTCVRCGACAIIAPAVFELTRKGTRVVREPIDAELPAVRAASLMCPKRSITLSITLPTTLPITRAGTSR